MVTDTDASNGILAKVTQVLAYGLNPRVELESVDKEGAKQHFQVSLPAENIKALDLQNGQVVRLVPSRLKVFERNDTVQAKDASV
ncbi:TOBE-like domain-containing protein [Methylophaga lonarensis]|uniref:TOBE-like domain-containing protein n=1 Tax=Methylophaga lonarensis TaxID=999151 RepID=UPI003D28E270